jgi:hypothetical protein
MLLTPPKKYSEDEKRYGVEDLTAVTKWTEKGNRQFSYKQFKVVVGTRW